MKVFRRRKAKQKTPKTDTRNTLLPPEGVPLNFEVAGVGVRLGAQISDVLITTLAALALVLILDFVGITSGSTTGAVFMLFFFFTRIPYYAVSELAWNGQTLGKRLLKIKVVSNDGGPLTTHALVVRNLMKEAEVFLPGTLLLTLPAASAFAAILGLAWVAMAFAVPLFNARRRRLGDLIAGTYVIHLPEPVLLKDLAQEAPRAKAEEGGFAFLSHHLDHYGAYELQTLEDLLRADQKPAESPSMLERQKATRALVVEKIRKKIGYAEAISEREQSEFLMAFYNAQRAHLEQRQLFGDRRADKHHAKEEDPDTAR